MADDELEPSGEEALTPPETPEPKEPPKPSLKELLQSAAEDELKELYQDARVQSEIDRRAKRDSNARVRQELEKERARLQGQVRQQDDGQERVVQQWLTWYDKLPDAESKLAAQEEHPFLPGLLHRRNQGTRPILEEAKAKWSQETAELLIRDVLESEEFQELPDDVQQDLQASLESRRYGSFVEWQAVFRKTIREHRPQISDLELSKRIEVGAKKLAEAILKERNAEEREKEPATPVMPGASGSPGSFTAIEEGWLKGEVGTETYTKARKRAGLSD